MVRTAKTVPKPTAEKPRQAVKPTQSPVQPKLTKQVKEALMQMSASQLLKQFSPNLHQQYIFF